MTLSQTSISLSVALHGAGWHPAAWRHSSRPARDLFTASFWSDQVKLAESGFLDFVTIDDSFTLQSTRPQHHPDHPQGPGDRVRGRFDAVSLASRLAPLTSQIGLVPAASIPQNDPFRTAAVLATLDATSGGRAGWQVQVSGTTEGTTDFDRPEHAELDPAVARPDAARHLRRRFAAAAEVVEVVRSLWDSRAQGKPLITALAHSKPAYDLAARSADLVFVTPRDAADAQRMVEQIRTAEIQVGRWGPPLRIVAEILVFLDATASKATARQRDWDAERHNSSVSHAFVAVGTLADLADQFERWRAAGVDGFRLRPASAEHDLTAIVSALVPELQHRGVFRHQYGDGGLRDRLGFATTAQPKPRIADLARSRPSHDLNGVEGLDEARPGLVKVVLVGCEYTVTFDQAASQPPGVHLLHVTTGGERAP